MVAALVAVFARGATLQEALQLGVACAAGLNGCLMLIFPPIVLQAKWFVLIYGAIELWAGVTSSEAGVAHFAHLGGMFFGYLLLLYWQRHLPG